MNRPHDDNAAIELRLLTEDDLPMLHDWLNRPHIVEWWQGNRPTLQQVRDHYLPRVLAQEKVTPYIGLLHGKPFAYAQSYVAMGAGGGWWEDETDPGVRGIDQSIADPELLGRGFGTQLVKTLVRLVFADPRVTKVQTDPAPDNLRAIRCYEKAGFRKVREIVTPDGPAIYMLQHRPVSAGGLTLPRPDLLQLTRRPALEADVQFLLELRRQAMGPVHTAARVDQSPEHSVARVRSNFDCAEIIELNGRPIGLLKVIRSPTEWRVSQIQLLPEHQGKAIGTKLLEEVLANARAAGLVVTLSALKINPAVRLYRRLGFTTETESEKSVSMTVTPT